MQASVLRIGLVVLLSLATCSAPDLAQTPQVGEHIQFVLWHNHPDDQKVVRPLRDLIWVFQQRNPDVLIHWSVRPTAEAYQRLAAWTDADEANAPDMTVVPALWLDEWGHGFRSMDRLLPSDRRQSFYAPVLDLFTYDRQWAVPWSVAARGLLVRSDLLEQHSLEAPTSWEEVQQVAAQLHDPPNVYGLGLPGIDGGSELFAELLWALGGALTDESGALSLDTDLATEALQLYCELARSSQPEALSWSQAQIEELFAQGRVAMIVTDTWVAQDLAQRVADLQFKLCPLPEQKQPVTHLRGEGLVIFRNSQHVRTCLEFARLVCQDDSQDRLLALGGMPTTRSLAAQHRSDQLRGALIPALDQARVLKAPTLQPLQERVGTALYLALSGRATPAQALQGVSASLTAVDETP